MFYITKGVYARLRNQHCSDTMIYLWHLDVAASHVFFFCYQHILVPQSMPVSFTHSGSGLRLYPPGWHTTHKDLFGCLNGHMLWLAYEKQSGTWKYLGLSWFQ